MNGASLRNKARYKSFINLKQSELTRARSFADAAQDTAVALSRHGLISRWRETASRLGAAV